MYTNKIDEKLRNARTLNTNTVVDIDDMIDQRYIDEELSDEFMYSGVSEMFKNDPMVKVLTHPLVYQDEELSRVCMMDFSEGSVHVGPKNLRDPIYYPKEDFTPVNMMLSWFDDFARGREYDLPDLPMPEPIIPVNQYYKPEDQHKLEYEMAMKQAILVDPTVSVRMDLTAISMCQIDQQMGLPTVDFYKDKNYDYINDRGQNESRKPFFFLPYKDVNLKDPEKKKIYESINYVSMQFNPFHPMATHFLRSVVWKGDVVKGTYMYREKERKYRFNINDQRYRVHSHVWLQLLSGHRFSGTIEVFDMVSNFDFNKRMKFVDRDIYVEPLIIEPLVCRKMLRDNGPAYSLLGQGNYFDLGMGNKVICPYMRFVLEFPEKKYVPPNRRKTNIQEDNKYVWVDDITNHVIMAKDRLSFLYKDNHYRFKKKEVEERNIYCKWYGFDRFKMYEISLDQNSPEKENRVKFMRVDHKFYSFPRNVYGSLIYDYKCIQLKDALLMDATALHEYWPYLVPLEKDYDYDDSQDFNFSKLNMIEQDTEYIPVQFDNG